MNATILNEAFQHPADGWYQIEALGQHPHVAAGVVQVVDGTAAAAIVTQFNTAAATGELRHGRELLIDHEHFSDQPDQETRAYGWLQELQQRADGIYGRIRWTATGKAAVDGGDYRFFSTEYDPQDLKVLNGEGARRVRPLRLAGLSLTNMNNNRGQKPITNRAAGNSFTNSGELADNNKTMNQGTSMKSVCILLGLPAEAEETAVHAAVTKLLNRGDISPEALATLRTEHQSLNEQNRLLVSEQSETLLDGCGVREERLRARLADGMKPLKNRQERLNYLADFGYQPGETVRAANGGRVLNRGTGPVRDASAGGAGESDQAVAVRIQNRAGELQGKGLKYDLAWNQARREVLGKN